jgi:hypothetical protein
MRIAEAIRSGLLVQPAVMPRVKLPEGRWGNRTVGFIPGNRHGLLPSPPIHPDLSSRLVTAKTPQVTMADKANKVIEKQFNK